MQTLRVAQRFCGPPGCANGGYLSGLIAQALGTTVKVRLQRPVPLDCELLLKPADDGAHSLYAGESCLATARPEALQLAVPKAPSYLEALDYSRRFVGLHHHAFPRCFVCGTARARGDGLRIFAGRAADGQNLVAAPWTPDASLAGSSGRIAPEFMAAALDCPGYFAARDDLTPMLLGEYISHIDRLVHVDEPCVLVGWKLAAEGRKYQVGTALFDEDGELCGRALATWIEPRPGSSVAEVPI